MSTDKREAGQQDENNKFVLLPTIGGGDMLNSQQMNNLANKTNERPFFS